MSCIFDGYKSIMTFGPLCYINYMLIFGKLSANYFFPPQIILK